MSAVTSLDPDDLMRLWPPLIGAIRQMLPSAGYAVWEDVAADTVERAVRNAHRYEDRGRGPFPWLITIASRIVIDHSRRQRHRQHESLDVVNRGTTDAGCARHLEQIDVRAAIATLPADLVAYASQRADDVHWEEAGARVGWPRSMTWRREQTVRALLRPMLAERDA